MVRSVGFVDSGRTVRVDEVTDMFGDDSEVLVRRFREDSISRKKMMGEDGRKLDLEEEYDK